MKMTREVNMQAALSGCSDQLPFSIFDLDLLFGENPRENIIINVLCEEFLKMLENEKGNETGVFGVRVGNFSDGITWFYKDLFKSQFVKVNPIFADSILCVSLSTNLPKS